MKSTNTVYDFGLLVTPFLMTLRVEVDDAKVSSVSFLLYTDDWCKKITVIRKLSKFKGKRLKR